MAAAIPVALALQFGFDQPLLPRPQANAIQLAALVYFIAYRVLVLVLVSERLRVLRRYSLDIVIIVATVVAALLWSEAQLPVLIAATYFAVLDISALVPLALHHLAGEQIRAQRRPKPARVMLVSFAMLISTGGSLLALPRATSGHLRDQDAALSVLHGFFTATSAACVTGLVICDTGRDYTFFGQLVILVLIQLGGLGIMIFGSVFGVLFFRQLSLRESLVLQDIYSHQTLSQIKRMSLFICVSTFVVEALGAILLYGMWSPAVSDPSQRWFYSIFHAVSAFCNAGFALQADSLIPFNTQWQAYGVIMPLVILGGLGFPVLADLSRWIAVWVKRLIVRLRSGHRRSSQRPHRLNLHTRLVLLTTAVLLVVPTLAIIFFESGTASTQSTELTNGWHWPQSLLSAAFQSATCRTAGFNTVPLGTGEVSSATQFLMTILMFIGGSPASTAGGVKTVTLAVMFIGVASTIHKRRRLEVCHRTIPDQLAREAAVVVITMLSLVSLIVMTLCYTEDAPLNEVIFESVSACGTVGLSTGLTPHLTIAGKLVIMLAMLAGRLGPLTLLIAVGGRAQVRMYDYPTEQVTIG